MPIQENSGVITYTPVTNTYNSSVTGVYQHNDFAVCHPTEPVKQIQFAINNLSPGAAVATIQVDMSGGTNTTIDLTSIIPYNLTGTGNNTQVFAIASVPSTLTTGAGNFYMVSGDPIDSLTTGNYNTFIGTICGVHVSSGQYNYASGYRTGAHITTSSSSTYIGQLAGTLWDASHNTLVGYNAGGGSGATGGYNTGIGDSTLYNATSGTNNAGVGYYSLVGVTQGHDNTGIGYQSGLTVTSGSNNVCVGSGADVTGTSVSNAICIGQGVTGGSNTTTIGNSSTTTFTPYGTISPPAGTATQALMKFASGSQLTSATDGCWEYDGTHLYFTIGTTRHTLI